MATERRAGRGAKALRAAWQAWLARQAPEPLERLEAEASWFRGLSDDEFCAEPNQLLLWRSPLAGAALPPAEAVDAAALAGDPGVVGALRALRRMYQPPPEATLEAEDRALIAAWGRLCDRVRPRVHALPIQRMLRVAAALLPERVGLPAGAADEGALGELLRRRRRLRAVIGAGRGLRDQISRAVFLGQPGLPGLGEGEAEEAGEPGIVAEAPEPWRCPFNRVREALREEGAGFVWEEGTLQMLHAAWGLRRRFVILAGIPGIGKTALLHRYARATCRALGQDAQAQVRLLAVAPDWQDPGSLFGWLQPLAARPAWVGGPGLPILQAALRYPERPYFLILDEINLARVERYLAPALSAMESGEPLQLHSHDRAVDGVPPRLPWPPNLFLGGTLNMDESTHALSDRVLDRAFLIELRRVDLQGWMAGRALLGRPVAPEVGELLLDLQAILEPVGAGFAFRAAEEVDDFVREAAGLGVAQAEALDMAIRSRVLVRVRGAESEALRGALEALRARLERGGLRGAAGAAEAMIARLRARGVTGYW